MESHSTQPREIGRAASIALAGAALGSTAMYMLDPRAGTRRRAELVERLALTRKQAVRVAQSSDRERQTRFPSFFKPVPPSDEALTETLRSAIEQLVRQPAFVEIAVWNGDVVLSGSLDEPEHKRLLKTVRKTPGVKEVLDRLWIHRGRSNEVVRANELEQARAARIDEAQREGGWPTAARIAVGASGAALGLYGARTHGLSGALALIAGTALLLRTSINRPLKTLAPRANQEIDIETSVDIDLPVDQVYSFLERYENFPYFMRYIRDVERLADGRSHWTAVGPVGRTVTWDSITTASEPDERIAWHTTPASSVRHHGELRCTRTDTGTHVDVRLTYTPPEGPLGRAMALLFGADPKVQLDQDLRRLKLALETGRTAPDAARKPDVSNS